MDCRNTILKNILAGAAIASLGLLPLQAFAAQTAADSLAAYWKFDEASGTSAADSSGDGKTGTLVNAPTVSTDVPTLSFGSIRSLSFNGTDEYVSMTSPRTAGNAAFTYSLWFKTTDSTNAYRTMFGEGNSGSDSQTFHIQMPSDADGTCTVDDSIKVYMNDNSAGNAVLCSGAAYNDGSWHNVVLTSNGSNSHVLYVDGTQVDADTTSIGTTTFNSAAIGALRNSTFSQFFPGNIDDVRVYTRVLSAGEIADIAAGRHTFATWDGSTDASFEYGANWDTNYVPDPFTRLTIAKVDSKLTLTGAIQFSSLTIGTGTVMKLNGNNITSNDNGAFINHGTLALKNTETVSMNPDIDRGTVMYMGTGSTTGFKMGNEYHNLTINDGMLLYLPFDETSGTRTADLSGYSNSGVLVNGAAFSTTAAPTNFANAGSVSFDGSNDYVDTTYDTAIAANKGYMISAWIRSNATTGNKLIFDRDAATLGIINIGMNGTTLYCVMRDDNSGSPTVINVANALVADTWTHVACGRDAGSSNMRFYINGNLAGRFTGQTGPITSTIRVGNHQNAGAGWNGYVDDVRLYGRQVTPGEVAALAAGNQPSLKQATVTLNNLLTVHGALTLNGGTLDVSTDNPIQAFGDWVNNGGVFNARSGYVEFLGDGDYTVLSGGQRFNNVTFNEVGSSWTLQDPLSVVDTAGIAAGTLDVNASGNYTIRAGNFTDSGVGTSFLPRSGAVILNASSNQELSFYQSLHNLHIEDPTENGLVGYWKFDEGTNTGAILDVSGQGNSGVRSGTGAIWSNADKAPVAFGNPNAMQFNGFNDHVSVADDSALDLSGDATLSLWVKWGDAIGTDDDTLIDKTQSGDAPNYRLYLKNSGGDAGKFGLWNGTTAAVSDATVSRGEWHHIAVTFDGTDASFYLDGELDSTASVGLGSVNNGPLLIGTDPQALARHFHGSMDDVRIYDRTLSGDEIAKLYDGFYADGDNGTATTSLIAGLDVAKLSVFSGKFFGGSEELDVSSDLNNYSGDSGFDATYGTVELDGTGTQNVRGSNTFGTLNIETATARTVNFESGSMQTVLGGLAFAGQAGNLLTLAPLTAAATWGLNLAADASQDVSYVSTSYSDASDGDTIDASDGTSVDGGHNLGWRFVAETVDSSEPSRSQGGGGTRGRRVTTENIAAAAQAIATRFQERQHGAAGSLSSAGDSGASSSEPKRQVAEKDRRKELMAERAKKQNLLLVTIAEEPVLYVDVKTDAWYAPFVSILVEENIARGYKDDAGKLKGEFGVTNAVTRAEVLKMAMEAAGEKPAGGTPRNASAKGTWASGYVKAAEERGISVFAPDTDVNAPATRGEVVQIILETAGFPLLPTWGETFSDVPKSHAHARAIATATAYELIKGDADAEGKPLGTFRPNDAINRAEVAKIIALLWEALK